MIIRPAERTGGVKEYYFSSKLKEIAKMNEQRAAEGAPGIISLGVGAPDRMPPAAAVEELCSQAARADVHAYQSYVGIPQLREAVAAWYSRYYGVKLNPVTEIQPLVGSKEGILLTCLAFLDKGDKVLVPDPGYPTYMSAARLVQAEVITYDLKEENGWLPDFEALEKMDLKGVKIMWTNYPNMPTGALATEHLYGRLVDFGRRHGILVCNDNPYSFILTETPLSILSVPGAKDCCLELNSLSKAHNMSGWRIGMVAAAPDVISEILKVKSQMDSGMFRPLQLAAVKALESGPEWFEQLNAEYAERRKLAGRIFELIGVDCAQGGGGLFLWGKVREDSPLLNWKGSVTADVKGVCQVGAAEEKSLGERLSDAALYGGGVFITPGFIFGKNGRDYARISLCATLPVLQQAYDRLANLVQIQL